MEIQILQGLNDIYSGSTIVIPLKEDIPLDIVNDIKNIHPMFMYEYKYEDKKIYVHSPLTWLWYEIGKALQKLSTKDWSYDYTKKHINEVIIKKFISNMDNVTILHTAMQEGYEITPMYIYNEIDFSHTNNARYVIGTGSHSTVIRYYSSSNDSVIGYKTQRDKMLTNAFLDKLGIPTPKWKRITSNEDIDALWDSYSKPVVIKPVGFTAGNGVVTNIDTKEKAYKAFKFAHDMTQVKAKHSYQFNIIMQEQVYGDDYRLLVINNKLMITTKRIPAFVVGNGKNSIKELVEEINKDPRRDILNPTHILKPIVFDEQFYEFLKEQGLNENFVPNKDDKIYVRKVASMSKGGITEDYTDKVHPQIKAIVESLASSLHAYVLGIDVYCKDISKPLTKENGAILECNTSPEAFLNVYPYIGKPQTHVAKYFLNNLIQGPAKQIVIIDEKPENAQKHLSLMLKPSNTLMYSNNNIYINNDLLSHQDDPYKAMQQIKINRFADTLIIHMNKEDFHKYGSGFERIDLVLINKEYKKEIDTFKQYQLSGLILDLKEI